MYEFVCERQRQKVLTSNSILPVSPEDIFVPLNVFFFCIIVSVQDGGGEGAESRNNPRTQFSKGPGHTLSIL